MPKRERNGGVLLVAYILIQDEKGNDDDDENLTRTFTPSKYKFRPCLSQMYSITFKRQFKANIFLSI